MFNINSSNLESNMNSTHNHIGDIVVFKIAIGLGLFNIGLGIVLLSLVLLHQLHIGTALIAISSSFIFFILFALQSLTVKE